ncbi:DUF6231 family protein [Psychrobacter sp. UBA3962]|uniref:DUF6231 family protein n=1 Tax=Psychrobacter sp. UBA3962 TaxID=1947352 RepID=UPI0025F30FB0|nr:DUF6231 family protein [Psychrobacter sp. UBA3962]
MSLTTGPKFTSYLNNVAAHILQVVHQLTLPVESEAQSNQQESSPFNMLLISDDQINELLYQLLIKDNPKLIIDSLTLTEFEARPFNKRYTLGCLVQPFELNSESNRDKTQAQANTATYSRIAIRLRDLFAEQSLLLTYTPLSELNFNCLGYIAHPIETSDEIPDFVSWQFNLYDYKQRPDWLNAKYWANPENFDKYRW